MKKNASETDVSSHIELRKVRMSSGGGLSSESVVTTNSSERKSKSLESSNGEVIMSSSILLVDMNGECTPSPITDNQIPDPSGSPPESPVLDETSKCENDMNAKSIMDKVGLTTRKVVKRLTREVSRSIYIFFKFL